MKSYIELKRENDYKDYKIRVLEEIIIKYEKFIMQHNKELLKIMEEEHKND